MCEIDDDAAECGPSDDPTDGELAISIGLVSQNGSYSIHSKFDPADESLNVAKLTVDESVTQKLSYVRGGDPQNIILKIEIDI